MRQSNSIIETAVDFAIMISKEQMSNLHSFITFCWECLYHLSDVGEFTVELFESIRPSFININGGFCGVIHIIPIGYFGVECP